METLEKNRIIAEFMGGKLTKGEDMFGNDIDVYAFSDGVSSAYEMPLDCLCYEDTWEEIMPVVEKVANTIIKGHAPYNSDQFVRVEIIPSGYVKITNLRDTPIFRNVAVDGSLIQATYNAVYEFIKWHIALNK